MQPFKSQPPETQVVKDLMGKGSKVYLIPCRGSCCSWLWGKLMACCHNFIIVAVAKPKEKMENRIIFMEIFPVKHTKPVNLLGVVFLPAYAIF